MTIHFMPALSTEHGIPYMAFASRTFVEPAAALQRIRNVAGYGRVASVRE
jgi:hypothetical protein